MTSLPYSFFVPYAPYAVITVLPASDSKVIVRFSWSRKRASLAVASGEIPSTSIPSPASDSRAAVKSPACFVQPGVDAAG